MSQFVLLTFVQHKGRVPPFSRNENLASIECFKASRRFRNRSLICTAPAVAAE
jgi:hypothetical protein